MAHISSRKSKNQTNALEVDHQIRGKAKLPNFLYSPILRHLPPEIISYIFTLLNFSITPLTQVERRFGREKKIETQFILGAVCQDWRAIAWSTPDLWSSIDLLHLTKSTLNESRSSLVSDWLGRSGQLPLSIRIFFDSTQTPSPEFRVEIIFLAKIINQYSARWLHFDLTCPSKVVELFRAEGSHAPMLESLRLETPGCPDPDILATTCPRLRKLHFVVVQIANIQWNSVTHVCMEDMSLENCLNVLRSIPLLVHAEVNASVGRSDLESSDRIVIPLKSLQVGGRDNLAILRHLTCPALDELVIDSWRNYNQPEDCISFLAGSGQLRSFSILKCMLDSSGFINVLRAAPSITKLVLSIPLDSPMVTENILDVLGMVLSSQSNHSQPRFLPHLESFDYQGPFSYAPIYSWPPAATATQIPLRFAKFNFHSTTYTSADAISCFSSLIERGVTVHVFSKGNNILQSSIDHYEHKKKLLNQDWADNLDVSLIPI